jgi:hypothetical protein
MHTLPFGQLPTLKLDFLQIAPLPHSQRCQIKRIKSARSDVKIRQNPPFSIGQIRQKSARNLELFVLFFTPWGGVLWFFIADLA